jgi:hypothetical protein
MTLRVLASLTIRLDGQVIQFEPGNVLTVTDAQAQRIMQRAPDKVQVIALPLDSNSLDGPMPPLQPGWLVVYRERTGVLCGGCEDRAHGTVQSCTWDGAAWTVILTDWQRLPLTAIRSVGRTNAVGDVVAAWTVREHGYDGNEGQG